MATLAELDERLSFRLGEVDDGLWTSQEKKMVLNQAQVEVAKDFATERQGMGCENAIPYTLHRRGGILLDARGHDVFRECRPFLSWLFAEDIN